MTATDIDRLHARLVTRAADEGLLDVAYRVLDSPLGALLVAATPEGVVRVGFEVEGHDAVLADLAERVSSRVLQAPARLDDVARGLDAYFSGGPAPDVPLDLRLLHG